MLKISAASKISSASKLFRSMAGMTAEIRTCAGKSSGQKIEAFTRSLGFPEDTVYLSGVLGRNFNTKTIIDFSRKDGGLISAAFERDGVFLNITGKVTKIGTKNPSLESKMLLLDEGETVASLERWTNLGVKPAISNYQTVIGNQDGIVTLESKLDNYSWSRFEFNNNKLKELSEKLPPKMRKSMNTIVNAFNSAREKVQATAEGLNKPLSDYLSDREIKPESVRTWAGIFNHIF